MGLLRVLFISLVIIALIIFAFQNQQPVDVTLYKYQWKGIPLFVVLYLMFSLGAIVAGVLALIEQVRYRVKMHQAKREIRRLQEELHRYRLGTLEDLLGEEEPVEKR